jgi:molybdopterin-guanine dinucleotide biosynthesis protein A
MAEVSGRGPPIAGIVLAGGQARRMGGDKALRPLGGVPLLARAIERALPQVATLAVSAHGDAARMAQFGLPLLADSVAGFLGPLAGILAGMDWAAAENYTDLASFACDAPFFPADLVARLVSARRRDGATIARASSARRAHPVFALWPVRLRDELRRALRDDGARKVEAWSANCTLTTVEFPALPFDPFFNINTPEDLATAERLLATQTSADNASRDGMGKP